MAQARPPLWHYGDGAFGDPQRAYAPYVPLLPVEWITCLLMREELEYTLDGEEEQYRVDPNLLSNRFASDWLVLHLFSSIYWLTERHTSQYAFLKSGGMKFAEQLLKLTPEEIAAAARLQHARGGRIHGLRNLASDQEFPHNLSAAMNALQMGHADVMGTDGHRRLCRYEGNAYMTLFGEPVVFCTPNLADTKQPLLLVVQGVEIRLEDSFIAGNETLPKYRDMMKRLAGDPVGQALVFDKMMKLFFIHVLGVRPELLENRRRVRPSADQNWCTDGVAASSFGPGIFGPVLAFRGEIEAQGRGSLHPHILVWLLGMRPADVLRMLQRDPGSLQTRLATWMKQRASPMQSTRPSSVKRAPPEVRPPRPGRGTAPVFQDRAKFDQVRRWQRDRRHARRSSTRRRGTNGGAESSLRGRGRKGSVEQT